MEYNPTTPSLTMQRLMRKRKYIPRKPHRKTLALYFSASYHPDMCIPPQPKNQDLFIIGVMSGTSCDGIDIAIMNTQNMNMAYFTTSPFPEQLREPVIRLAQPSFDEVDILGHLDRALGDAFSEAILHALDASGIPQKQILAIAHHGQTIRHRPNGQHAFSMQIGCAATLAERTGITIISDFRSRDIAAGGQGAPLVPFAHARLFPPHQHDVVIINIGGIANITALSRDGLVEGFDTGPGNMLMDALMLALSDGRHAYDEDGELAKIGSICPELLQSLLKHPFFHQALPKSTGREEFGEHMLASIMAWDGISDADRMATCCALTVESIAMSIETLNIKPQQCFICGGGALNPYLMQTLAERLSPMQVQSTQACGIDPEAVEALSFAILGLYTLRGEPNTLASVTGAKHHSCGGSIAPSKNWSDVVQWMQQSIP